ncbi:MAG: hypothetical protein AAF984_10680 [Verrucomicrobiota bacterium]
MSDILDDPTKREALSYQQNCEQARALNQQMNNIPIWAMTLTGGLWYGAGFTEHLDEAIRFLLILFAGFCNLALAMAMWGLRDVLESYFEKIRSFNPSTFASGIPESPKMAWLHNYSIIKIYAILMCAAALCSFFVGFWVYWPADSVNVFWGIGVFLTALILIYFIAKVKPKHE